MDNQLMDLIVSVAVVIVTRYLVPYIKKHTAAKLYDHYVKMAHTAVRAAEQIYTNKPQAGDIKYDYAVRYLKARGITVTDDEIKALIEAALTSLKALK